MDLKERFSWQGRTIHWGEFGSGPPVVFLHGTPFSSTVWHRYAAALQKKYTVYLWDMPGYGRSSKLADHAVDLETQGKLFAALLSAWGLNQRNPPHVIAHDFGGVVSLRALLLEKCRYQSLCLVDAVAVDKWGSPFFRLVRENPNVFEAMPIGVHRGAVESYIQEASYRALTPEELSALVVPWITEDGQPAFYRQIAEADQKYSEEYFHLLREIKIPVHIIWGAQDVWIPPDRADTLKREIQHSSVAIVQGAGHLIQYDQPVSLAIELAHWLALVS